MRSGNREAKNSEKSATYRQSGVNIDEGNRLVDLIKPIAKATRRVGADVDLGGFGGLFDLKKLKYKDPVLVSGTDGVGTKLKLAYDLGKHDTIGIDLVAMSVNDIVVQGAEPLFFLDYFATSKLDNNIAKAVIKGIGEGCKRSGCALLGGETAEMPGIYKDKEYDLAGFAVGIVERKNILPRKNVAKGDVIIGIESSGVHSNGYSLVRYLLEKNKISLSSKAPFANKTVGEVLLTPTNLYVKACLELLNKTKVKAFAHITGGGILENIPRVLPDKTAAEIDVKTWSLPPLFKWLVGLGNIEATEALRTFNCGIGMVVVANKNDAKKIQEILKKHKFKSYQIGKIVEGKKQVIFKNLNVFGN